MARLWAHEAFAHGAEVVSYFRWRQAPFGQEQYHAALRLPDDSPAPVWDEIAQLAQEIAELPDVETPRAPVALVFDYQADWAWKSLPQGADCHYFALVFELYRAVRSLGLDVDILPPDGDPAGYAMVLAPGLAILPEGLVERIDGTALVGPRTGHRNADMATPTPLPPNVPGLDAQITHVETLPHGEVRPLTGGGALKTWVEVVKSNAEAIFTRSDGISAVLKAGRLHYLCGWPDAEAAFRILTEMARGAGLDPRPMPSGLRTRETRAHRIWFNYAPETQMADGKTIAAADLHRAARS